LRAVFASFAAFVAAGLRPRTPLAKAIALVLVIKLIAIAGVRIYMVVSDTQPAVDANAMAQAFGLSSARK
jgi:hypothetical protein